MDTSAYYLPPVTKRYFTTNTEYNILPVEFTGSPNTRYIHVLACHLFYDDPDIQEGVIKQFSVPQYYSLHADFVQDAPHMDGYVCMANQPLYQRKKYQQIHRKNSFTIWFKNHTGELITLDANYHFVLELMLEY